MKTNLQKKFFIIILFLMVLKPAIMARADELIPASDFEDEQFYQYVIENFDTNGDGTLSESEAQAVTEIDIGNVEGIYGEEGITSIKGMEHFSNLDVLIIGYNNFTSLEPIRGLPLTYLNMGPNEAVTDFSPIYDLKLYFLSLFNTNISDISFLTDMKTLTTLSVYGCDNITDYSAISELENLGLLNVVINSGQFSVSILNNLENLTYLYLAGYGGAKITDVSGLARNQQITYLSILGGEMRDLNFLSDLKELKELSITTCYEIEDFSALGGATGLRSLRVSACNFKDVQILSSLIGLEELNIESNGIDTLPDMREWANLKNLWLQGNNISESEALSKLPAQITSQENWQETVGLSNYEEEIDSEEVGNQNNENNTKSTRVITSVSDDNIAAEGNIDSNIYLEGKKIDDTSPYEDMINEIETRKDNIEQIHVYDIWMYKNQVIAGQNVRIKVQPDGRIKVMIEIDGLEKLKDIRCYVFRQETDGSLTELSCYREGNVISFYSEHFSIFTVVIARLLGEDNNGEESGNVGTGHPNAHPVNMEQEAGYEKPSTRENNETGDDSEADSSGQSRKEENLKKQESRNIADSDSDEQGEYGDNKAKTTNMQGIAGVIAVTAVGLVIGGYDIYRRKKGTYLRNFESNTTDNMTEMREP